MQAALKKSAHRATVGLDFARWIIPLYLGLFMQNGVQQRIVNFNLSIVADEPKFAEFVHEVADAGSGRSNHLCQCLLADIHWNGLRVAFASEMREQQKKAGEPPLA